MKQFDAIVIGAGQAGPPLCAGIAAMGKTVALLEGNLLGGSCVNYGCTPTKTLRKSARVAHMARTAEAFGIGTGAVTVDFAAVMARVNHIVTDSRDGLRGWMQGYPEQITLIEAYGQFVGKEGDQYVIQAGDEQICAPLVYLNTGTRAFTPELDGLADVPYLDNVSLLRLKELPVHLVILGGGYIGVEMAQIFRRLGSEVTIIEFSSHLASREDVEVSNIIEELLTDEGVQVLVKHKAIHAAADGDGVHLTLEAGDAKVTVHGSHLLVAIGRTPNTDKLGLETVGVAVNPRGFITTDDHFQTSVPSIYALGDINGRGAFTHTSYQDYQIALDNLHKGKRSAADRTMTYAMFSDPPLGRVGMSERDARASGKKILVARQLMKDVSRAKEEGETIGVITVLVDAETERFVGACVFGIGGDEIVQLISNAMAGGMSYKVILESLPIHPTVTEFFPTILGSLKPLE